jgi:GT2 family glycosyltransferase
VAIVIPNRDQPDLLRRCVRFLECLHYPKRELIVVDHASTDPATLALYAELKEQHDFAILRVSGRFNFSRMANLGVAASTSEVVLLVNNDVEITQARQAQMMIEHAMRPEIGVVGALLSYPDGNVQHAGMVLRSGLHAGHAVLAQYAFRGAPKCADGYLYALRTVRNYQAVTGALIATRRIVFDRAGGFDEVNLPVEYNDVDYCLRVRSLGFRVIVVPTEGIVHRESSTRGLASTPEVEQMRKAGARLIVERWREAIDRDPFGNPHVDFGDRPQARLPWTEMAGRP